MGRPSQWKQIAESLIAKIESGELLPGWRVATEEEVAAEWGVSRPTAHRALADLQTKGYLVRQRRWGTVVAERNKPKTDLVGIVIDRFARSVDFPQIDMVHGLQEVMGHDHSLVWCDCKDDASREANFIRRMAQDTDGMIIFPLADPRNTAQLQSLVKAGKPVVVLDRVPVGYTGAAVLSETADATREVVQSMASRGHKRIAFFGFFKPNVSSVQDRFEAYQEGLKLSGLESSEPDVRWFAKELEVDGDLQRQAVLDAIFALTQRPDPVTAIYCVQDCLAVEALAACRHYGLSVPNQIEIALVNEWPAAMLEQPWKLHRIVRQKHEIGLAAGRLLMQQIHGEPFERLVQVPAELHLAEGISNPVSPST